MDVDEHHLSDCCLMLAFISSGIQTPDVFSFPIPVALLFLVFSLSFRSSRDIIIVNKPLAEAYECVICHDLFEHPVVLHPCAHSFCKGTLFCLFFFFSKVFFFSLLITDCISRSSVTSKKCPICRRLFYTFKFSNLYTGSLVI